MSHGKIKRSSLVPYLIRKKGKGCKVVRLLFFYAHEVIPTAVLKEEFHKVTMYSSSQSDYIEEDNTQMSNFSHLAM